MKITRRQTLTGLAALSALPATAWAHRAALTHTLIKWNAPTGFLDVTHRFHMHDAATAMKQAGLIDKPDLSTLEARARLALYTESHFSLAHLDKAPITLNLIGSDYEGRNAYVYQQTQLVSAPDGLKISCALLQALIPTQVNQVDIDFGGPHKSIQFKNGDPAKIVLA